MKRLVLVAVLSSLYLSCLKPPLTLEHRDDGLEVSVATLGEYPTSVSRIQVRDGEERKVVWELKTTKRAPQLWGFRLTSGDNPVEPEGVLNGDYEVIAPKHGKSFTLRPGRRYEVSVWNKQGTRRQAASFRFDD